MKKLIHFAFFLLFSCITGRLLFIIYWKAFLHFYKINIASPRTYRDLSIYWNNGGVIHGSDLLMISLFFTIIPVFIFLIYKIYKMQYLNIIIKPITSWQNYVLSNYTAKTVNIKNLKIEEKKSIDQLVQERLEKEQKNQQKVDFSAYRKDIINQIEDKIKS